jgi:flagellin
MIKNSDGLSASLEKLSSGLRINQAADDASGMAIADSLKSQALGLGQAVRNANDGISMVKTADGALDESIKIINTIKTKSLQAAQDGQTTDSRKVIQGDITKLMSELNTIAKTASFNGPKLLSGNFTNKQFQVGAYSQETATVSIASAEASKIGHVTTGNLNLTNATGGTVALSIYSNLQGKNIDVQAVDIKADNTAAHGMGALADAINKMTDVLGVSAKAFVSTTSTSAVAAGSTDSSFAINGVTIGAINVAAGDTDGGLVKAINNKTADTGVAASVDSQGKLTLNSADGRAISVTGGTGSVLAGSDMSTMGHLQLTQVGSNQLQVTDKAGGSATGFDAAITADGDVTTTKDSSLAAGSTIISTSTLEAGSTMGFALTGTLQTADISTTQDSSLKTGSVLEAGSTIKAGSVLGGTVTTAADATTVGSAVLKAGSTLAGGSILAKGTVLTQDLKDVDGVTMTAGSVLGADTELDGNDVTLSSDLTAANGSVIVSGSKLAANSTVGADLTTSGDTTLTQDMTLKSGSTIAGGGNLNLVAGSTVGGTVTLADDAVTTAVTSVKSNSMIADTSVIAAGSTLGGDTIVTADMTAQDKVSLAAGSIIIDGSVLAHGTVLTNDIKSQDGGGNAVTLKAGTTLEHDYTTDGDQTLANDMTVAKDSVIGAGSTLAANAGGSSGSKVDNAHTSRLSDINVLTQEGAQIAISVADSALKDLDKNRADLGAVQNQLTSTVANISATQVNVTSAESSIRDVDFAEEAGNFSKMQILNQAGSFAMAQANASSKNVMSLLQG